MDNNKIAEELIMISKSLLADNKFYIDKSPEIFKKLKPEIAEIGKELNKFWDLISNSKVINDFYYSKDRKQHDDNYKDVLAKMNKFYNMIAEANREFHDIKNSIDNVVEELSK